MTGIQLSGLASGFDWKSVVDQLIGVSGAPRTAMVTQQSTNSIASSALTEIKNLLSSFQSSLTSGFTDAGLQQRATALSSSTSTWKASSSAAGTVGDFSFTVSQTALAAKRLGASDVTGGISTTSNVSGLLVSSLRTAQTITSGAFTVNGFSVAVASTDTLQEVFDRISTATGGTVAAAYDPLSDGVSLTGTGNLSLGSAADTSNFLSAMKLFQNGTSTVASSGALGAAKLNLPLASSGLKSAITAVDGSGNGTFTINGAVIAYNLNTDSMQSVMTRISSSAAGVTASYDSASDRFTLTNKTTGNVSMFAEDAGAGVGFLAATGVTGAGSSFQSGQNAVFSVNGGGPITSLSNTLAESGHGISGLSLTVDSAGTQTVSVTSDTTSAKSQIDTLISKYNTIQAAIEKHTKVTVDGSKVTSGPLSGNTEVSSISSRLRSIIFAAGSGLTGDVKRLSDLGVDFSNADTNLAIRNQTTLNSKLSRSSVDVGAFFTDSTFGLVKRLNDFLTTQVSDNGSINTLTTNLGKQNTDIDKQIAQMNRDLASQRAVLESSFIAMETASSMYSQQLASLNATFGRGT